MSLTVDILANKIVRSYISNFKSRDNPELWMIFSKMFPNAHILVYFLMTQPNKFGKNEQLL